MTICFENAKALSEGITILAEDLGLTVVAEDTADVIVTVTQVEENILTVTRRGRQATITYGGGRSRFFRAFAKLARWMKDGVTDCTVTETPLFVTNGSMVDMSRNAVMNVPTVKLMLRKMALMGMNTFMLYTEDTYEVENRPYFGHMRGRYTAQEIRELDAYAIKLGIELIPCIQLLGHLATHLRWSCAGAYRDTANALRVGEDATYALIDDMLRSVSKNFSSRRIHIGMDETHDLGTGVYLDVNGYRERKELYFEHLNRVVEMVKGYGLKPMMWSDMIFRVCGKGLPNYSDYDIRVAFPENIREELPAGVQQVFWDYYRPNKEFYSETCRKHRQLCDDPIFAGGIWFWSGHVPLFSTSLRNSIPALEACRDEAFREVIATVWHNGSESCLVLSLAGLAWYADFDYRGEYSEDGVRETFRNATGCSYDDFLAVECMETPTEGFTGRCRSMLYNDPLLGLLDKHIEHLDTATYYKNALSTLEPLGDGVYEPAFAVLRRLADLLVNKADFGVRLKKAYDANDRAALEALQQECDVIITKLDALRDSHRRAWTAYSKSFGWEIHDIRYGGLRARFVTVKDSLCDYLNGAITVIEELEEERLTYTGRQDDLSYYGLWEKYLKLATTGCIV